MSKHASYVPKHRNAPVHAAARRRVRATAIFSGVAVAATGIAVSSGVLAQDPTRATQASMSLSSAMQQSHGLTNAELAERERAASRSDDRATGDQAKKDSLALVSGGGMSGTEDISKADPRSIARALMPQFGFPDSEFGCLDALWVSESGWNMHADNPTSSAYGIPQALTGGTHVLPADYMTNAESQIRWGLGYIRDAYGTPCSAWSFKQSHQWY